MIRAIYTKVKPAFYCKRCLDTNQIFYIDGKKRYCERCVPEDIKQQAIYYNQNSEELDKENYI